jgi:hypothetical protein
MAYAATAGAGDFNQDFASFLRGIADKIDEQSQKMTPQQKAMAAQFILAAAMDIDPGMRQQAMDTMRQRPGMKFGELPNALGSRMKEAWDGFADAFRAHTARMPSPANRAEAFVEAARDLREFTHAATGRLSKKMEMGSYVVGQQLFSAMNKAQDVKQAAVSSLIGGVVGGATTIRQKMSKWSTFGLSTIQNTANFLRGANNALNQTAIGKTVKIAAVAGLGALAFHAANKYGVSFDGLIDTAKHAVQHVQGGLHQAMDGFQQVADHLTHANQHAQSVQDVQIQGRVHLDHHGIAHAGQPHIESVDLDKALGNQPHIESVDLDKALGNQPVVAAPDALAGKGADIDMSNLTIDNHPASQMMHQAPAPAASPVSSTAVEQAPQHHAVTPPQAPAHHAQAQVHAAQAPAHAAPAQPHAASVAPVSGGHHVAQANITVGFDQHGNEVAMDNYGNQISNIQVVHGADGGTHFVSAQGLEVSATSTVGFDQHGNAVALDGGSAPISAGTPNGATHHVGSINVHGTNATVTVGNKTYGSMDTQHMASLSVDPSMEFDNTSGPRPHF